MQATAAGNPNAPGSQAPNLSVTPATATTPSGPTTPYLTVPQGPGSASGPSSAATSSATLHRLAIVSSSNAGHDKKAERKKLCDALIDAEGEIPILNVDDNTWNVTRSGPLVRSSGNNSWIDLFAVLTEKYFFLIKEETDPQGTTRRSPAEKPIPLECLCLTPSDDEPAVRKHDPGFFKRAVSCFSPVPTDTLHPFTIYHAAARITRRYTLCAETATERNKWRTVLSNAIEAQKARHDLYRPQTLNDDFFRIAPHIQLTRGVHYTGHAVCAAEFSSQGEDYIAIGCTSGIYVSNRGANSYRKVLDSNEPTSMVALQDFDKFLVLCESTLYSYPLEMVIRTSQGELTYESLIESEEKLGQGDEKILFFKAGRLANRTLIVYAAKSPKECKLHVLEVTNPVGSSPNPPEIKDLCTPITIPEDPHDATFYLNKIELHTSKAIYSIDPTNTTSPLKPMPEIPDPKGSPNASQRMRDRAKTLFRRKKSPMPKILELVGKANVIGMVRHGSHTLVIYDEFGCFIDGDGKPASPPYFVSWDSQAKTYALRGSRLLLFSPGYIEVRNVDTGELIQVIKGDVRTLRCGLGDQGMLVAAASGGSTEDGAGKERLVELVYNGQ